jgi:hypothetical protein
VDRSQRYSKDEIEAEPFIYLFICSTLSLLDYCINIKKVCSKKEVTQERRREKRALGVKLRSKKDIGRGYRGQTSVKKDKGRGTGVKLRSKKDKRVRV